MSYITNINIIDQQLKKVFSDVEIKLNNHKELFIICKKPVNQNIKESLELNILLNQENLNSSNPHISGGYYADSRINENLVNMNSPISELGFYINNIISNNRMDGSYLESIPENKKEITEKLDINNINQTFVMNDSRISISRKKLKAYLYKFVPENISMDITISYLDVNSGMKIQNPRLGNESTLSITFDKSIPEASWYDVQINTKKISLVEDINSFKARNLINIVFSTKVIATLRA